MFVPSLSFITMCGSMPIVHCTSHKVVQCGRFNCCSFDIVCNLVPNCWVRLPNIVAHSLLCAHTAFVLVVSSFNFPLLRLSSLYLLHFDAIQCEHQPVTACSSLQFSVTWSLKAHQSIWQPSVSIETAAPTFTVFGVNKWYRLLPTLVRLLTVTLTPSYL